MLKSTQFFLNDAKSKKILEWYKSGGETKLCSVVTKKGLATQFFVKIAIVTKASGLLREAENDYRLSIGAKKVGESWISETELFYKLKKAFNNQKVIHHGNPQWLGLQHIDIWLPKYKIGVEYQGKQHDEPVEFFGGEEAFRKNQERDNIKKELFKKNNSTLIEVRPNYNIDEVIKEISKHISTK